jgi:hypothetical protein
MLNLTRWLWQVQTWVFGGKAHAASLWQSATYRFFVGLVGRWIGLPTCHNSSQAFICFITTADLP